MEILLKQLNEAGVRYVVIGGQAMLQEGMPRFTLDWDLFIPPRDEANFERINTVLDEELDIPLVPYEIPMRKEYDFSKGIKNPYK